MSDALDLITLSECTAYLAAGGNTPTSAQTTQLPALITAASKQVQRVIGRFIPAADYDEVLTPSQGRPDRGEPATCKTRQYPVNDVYRAAGGRTGAVTIRNTDSSTNQMARVALVETGNPEVQLTTTGVKLTRVASAVTTNNTLLFATYTTVQSLADAVNALGNGWVATVTTNYALWPSTELMGARETKNALGSGCQLDLFSVDLSSYSIDRGSGIVSIGYGPSFAPGGYGTGYGTIYGFGAWDDYDDADTPAGRGQIRVKYNGGYSTIPESLQKVTAQVVSYMIDQLKTDQAITSESADGYSYTARAAIDALPKFLRDELMTWKAYRA